MPGPGAELAGYVKYFNALPRRARRRGTAARVQETRSAQKRECAPVKKLMGKEHMSVLVALTLQVRRENSSTRQAKRDRPLWGG